MEEFCDYFMYSRFIFASLSNFSGVEDSLFINSSNVIFIILMFIICLIGIGASTAFLIPWSLLPDAIDESRETSRIIYCLDGPYSEDWNS